MTGFVLLLVVGCLHPHVDKTLVNQLDREVMALRKRNAYLQDQAEQCGFIGAPAEVYAQLVQVFSGTEVLVERDDARTAVVIPGGLLFSPGSVRVRTEADMVLDMLSTALNLHRDQQIWIIGHTDDQPLSGSLRRRYGDNWALSSARAGAIMAGLTGRFGVAPERFTIAGRGSMDPVADNDTPEGREQNRRVVVLIGPAETWR